jgi:hypothetical protein
MFPQLTLKSLLHRGKARIQPPAWTAPAITFLLQWPIIAVGFSLTFFIDKYLHILDQLDRPDRSATIFFVAYSLPSLIISWLLSLGIGFLAPGFTSRILGSSWGHPEPNRESEKLDEILEQRGQLDAKNTTLLDRLIVMQEIDERVERLRNRTSAFLVAIALALVAAAIVVLFAGRLTSIDAEAVSNVDRGKTELAEAVRSMNRLLRYQSLFQELDKATSNAASPGAAAAVEKRIGEIKKEIDSLSPYPRDISPSTISAAPVDLDSATSMVKTQRKEVENLEALVDDVRKKELLADRGYGDWRYIVATAITRVGVVLIIVFLVQILMGLYRYNTKLIAYYNSRRDLITLWDGKQATLASLDKALTLPQIDFGKEPKHPLEDIIRAVGSGKPDAGASGGSTRAKK